MFRQNKMRRLRRVLTPILLFVASATNAGEDHQHGLPNDPAMTGAKAFNIKFVALQNRVKLAYVEQGDPSGVPVLLLHGYSDSWHSFELVLPYLPKSIHVFALSQRGHGDSGRPETGYHPRDFTADVVAFMDALKLERAVIVGHSMGSYIAQCFAINYPERTLGLVLVGSFTTLRGDKGIQEFWDAGVSKLEDPIDPNFALAFQKSTLALPVPQTFMETVVQESLKVPAYVWKAALQALMETDFSGELGKITAPTLIVWGDKDALFFRDDQDALAAAIAGSQLVIYHGVGHGVHWEEPKRFAADLGAFTEKLVK